MIIDIMATNLIINGGVKRLRLLQAGRLLDISKTKRINVITDTKWLEFQSKDIVNRSTELQKSDVCSAAMRNSGVVDEVGFFIDFHNRQYVRTDKEFQNLAMMSYITRNEEEFRFLCEPAHLYKEYARFLFSTYPYHPVVL
jgi:hypothetical protein